jgi:hypothetical protein
MSDLFDPDWSMKQAFPGFQRYAVTWHVDAVKFGRSKMSLGICAKTGGVAFAASDLLHPLIVQDVLTNKIGCDDAKWCLDIDCPYNKAEPIRMRHYGIRNRHELENVHRRLEEWISKAELKPQELHTQILHKEPAIIIKKAPKK